MTADDIENYKWLEFVSAKLGTRHWVVTDKMTFEHMKLGYTKAVTPRKLEKLREEFQERQS